jgi:hypothetical protein
VLISLHDLLLGNELRCELAHSPALWFTFGALGAVFGDSSRLYEYDLDNFASNRRPTLTPLMISSNL